MMKHFATIDGSRTALPLDGQPLGRGGEANVYRILGRAGAVAKIYHLRNSGARADRAKLEAMIQAPPSDLTDEVNGRPLPHFAWPTHVVDDETGRCTGFLMPEVPLNLAVTLETYMSRSAMRGALSPDDCSLPRRVQICRNLAAAIAELHRQGHLFVDIKPQNIYLFKDTGIVCLVDNDSFSIARGDGTRFAATAYSPEYIAPEVLRTGVKASNIADDRQDCYALAVLMFRILDNGVHPFQGVPRLEIEDWNIDLCVREGYYPHGTEPHEAIAPSPLSTYHMWEAVTRGMFDRAFVSATPVARPSALEWQEHFDSLQQRGRGAFVRCKKANTDVRHIHFSGAKCPECYWESLDSQNARASSQPSNATDEIPPTPTQVSSQMPSQVPSRVPSQKIAKWATAVVGMALVVGGIWLFGEKQLRESAPPPRAPSAQPAARHSPQPDPASEVARARQLQGPGDAAGLAARQRIVARTIDQVSESQRGELMAVLKIAQAGDDVRTLASAQRMLRGTDWDTHFAGWSRFRTSARALNDEAIRLHEGNLPRAVALERDALALDPFDREIAGNLAYFLAKSGQATSAHNTAVYALSLPRRNGQDTGRSADWQSIGSTLALMNRREDSSSAYYVALAITPSLSGLCASLLHHQATMGDRLKPPIDAVFSRINGRGLSSTGPCAYPPQWRN